MLCLAFVVLASSAWACLLGQPATRPVVAALLSDTHLDPFRDPAKVKRLASADVEQWAAILAEAASSDAETQFSALQETCKQKLSDTDAALELSAFDDVQAAQPSFVLLGGDMLVHDFGCRYRALLDPTGKNTAGLTAFAAKTIQFQLQQLRERLPQASIHLALGNNDSDCDDYALDENSSFLKGLAPALVSGWHGATQSEIAAAERDFERSGSYMLPLSADLPSTRILVLDDLFLSADYKGNCRKEAAKANATALLAWAQQQLATARRAHQAVWVLAHIPPDVNVYRTYQHPHDICHGEAAAMFLGSNALSDLLIRYSDIVRIFISGHTHVDEIHLLESQTSHSPLIALKTIPSVSPISGNASAYLLGQVDPTTAELLDFKKRVASGYTGRAMQWATAYDFRARYHEPAYTAAGIDDLLQRWQKAPEASAAETDAYAQSIASGLRLLAFRFSLPQQICAMQHSTASGFAACACSVSGGLLPAAQNAK